MTNCKWSYFKCNRTLHYTNTHIYEYMYVYVCVNSKAPFNKNFKCKTVVINNTDIFINIWLWCIEIIGRFLIYFIFNVVKFNWNKWHSHNLLLYWASDLASTKISKSASFVETSTFLVSSIFPSSDNALETEGSSLRGVAETTFGGRQTKPNEWKRFLAVSSFKRSFKYILKETTLRFVIII